MMVSDNHVQGCHCCAYILVPYKYLQIETDTFAAVQLAYDEMSEKHASKALKGHFAKAGTTPMRKLVEFKADFEDLSRFAR